MINKENSSGVEEPLQENKPVDVVEIDMQCHILIRDVDTKEILVNTRG